MIRLRRQTTPFEALRGLGLSAIVTQQWDGTHPLRRDDDDEERSLASWRCFDVTQCLSDRDVMIWCATAYQLAIGPAVPVMPFLADAERDVLVHVYDDRGMDIIALDREVLMPIYRMHDSWLLDYDRPRMIEAFGT